MNKKTARSAFTFVEFALIILLISLVFAGVMVGKELVNQSQIRSSLSQIQSYYAAINSFYEKYKAIPGDMDNATSFWGSYPTCPYNNSVRQTSASTCNGNNNKILNESPNRNTTGEVYLFWQHLSNAGLITGEYSGKSDRGNRFDVHYNLNTPIVDIPGGAISIQPYGANYSDGDLTFFPKRSRHYFVLGGIPEGDVNDPGSSTDWQYYPYTGYRLLSSIDALSIDEKLDDGMPGLGTIHTRRGKKTWKAWDHYTCSDDQPDDVDGHDAQSDNSKEAAQVSRYDPDLDGPQCYLLFQIDFPT